MYDEDPLVCTDLKDQMSADPNAGLDVGRDIQGPGSKKVELGNKWSNRRYDQPGTSDPVGEAGIGATKVAIKYDLVDSAHGPGVAVQLLRNPTDLVLPTSQNLGELA